MCASTGVTADVMCSFVRIPQIVHENIFHPKVFSCVFLSILQ